MVYISREKGRRNILAPRRQERKVKNCFPWRPLRESLPLALIIYFLYFAFFAVKSLLSYRRAFAALGASSWRIDLESIFDGRARF